jgi:hypothetical protein
VAGKYVIFRILKGMEIGNISDVPIEKPEAGTFRLLTLNPDLQAITWALNDLQQKAVASNAILFNFGELINKINEHK